MAGENVQFAQSTPSDWQSFLTGLGNSALQIATSRLSKNDQRVSEVQQAPATAAGELTKYIPLLLVAGVILIGLVILKKR